LDKQGQPVLQFTSSSLSGSPAPVFEEVEHDSERTDPSSPPATKEIWAPKLRHQITALASPKKIPVPKAAEEIQYEIKRVDGFQVREPIAQPKSLTGDWTEIYMSSEVQSSVHSAKSELGLFAELEALGAPPGLHPPVPIRMLWSEADAVSPPPGLSLQVPFVNPGPPPGLSQTVPVSPPPGLAFSSAAVQPFGPPPGLGFPSAAIQPTAQDMSGEVEVKALLESISMELSRVASNLDRDSRSQLLSRESSESDLTTQASSGDGSNSRLVGQAVSVPLPATQEEVDLAMVNMWATSTDMWDSLSMPTMAADYSADYSQYFTTLGDYSMYAAPAPCVADSFNMADYTKPIVEDYSCLFGGAAMM